MYEKDSTGKCPHCRTAARFLLPSRQVPTGASYGDISTELFATTQKGTIHVYTSACPECHEVIVVLTKYDAVGSFIDQKVVYPANVVRLVPCEVPPSIGKDFSEASSVLSISEKNSPARTIPSSC